MDNAFSVPNSPSRRKHLSTQNKEETGSDVPPPLPPRQPSFTKPKHQDFSKQHLLTQNKYKPVEPLLDIELPCGHRCREEPGSDVPPPLPPKKPSSTKPKHRNISKQRGNRAVNVSEKETDLIERGHQRRFCDLMTFDVEPKDVTKTKSDDKQAARSDVLDWGPSEHILDCGINELTDIAPSEKPLNRNDIDLFLKNDRFKCTYGDNISQTKITKHDLKMDGTTPVSYGIRKEDPASGTGDVTKKPNAKQSRGLKFSSALEHLHGLDIKNIMFEESDNEKKLKSMNEAPCNTSDSNDRSCDVSLDEYFRQNCLFHSDYDVTQNESTARLQCSDSEGNAPMNKYFRQDSVFHSDYDVTQNESTTRLQCSDNDSERNASMNKYFRQDSVFHSDYDVTQNESTTRLQCSDNDSERNASMNKYFRQDSVFHSHYDVTQNESKTSLTDCPDSERNHDNVSGVRVQSEEEGHINEEDTLGNVIWGEYKDEHLGNGIGTESCKTNWSYSSESRTPGNVYSNWKIADGKRSKLTVDSDVNYSEVGAPSPKQLQLIKVQQLIRDVDKISKQLPKCAPNCTPDEQCAASHLLRRRELRHQRPSSDGCLYDPAYEEVHISQLLKYVDKDCQENIKDQVTGKYGMAGNLKPKAKWKFNIGKLFKSNSTCKLHGLGASKTKFSIRPQIKPSEKSDRHTINVAQNSEYSCPCDVKCKSISCMATGLEGFIWIAFFRCHWVVLYNHRCKSVYEVNVQGTVDSLATTKEGVLYISCPKQKKIMMVSTELKLTVVSHLTRFCPRGIAVCPSKGTLYACMTSEVVGNAAERPTYTRNNCVMKFKGNGIRGKWEVFNKGHYNFGYPLYLAISSNEYVLVSDFGLKCLLILDPSGEILQRISTLGGQLLSQIHGIACTFENEFVVAQVEEKTLKVSILERQQAEFDESSTVSATESDISCRCRCSVVATRQQVLLASRAYIRFVSLDDCRNSEQAVPLVFHRGSV